MGTYDFQSIEKKWQSYWKEHRVFVAEKTSEKPKYYVMDMFPYPSGSGLHVGHPLGYIATDIIARYKRLKGFNVLHPMGFDAFGLPAEQYAINSGIHPAITTATNIKRYKEQMEVLGFHYDPEATFSTSDPEYYKWTQWIFIQMFQHYYDLETDSAQPIEQLIRTFEQSGTAQVKAFSTFDDAFTAAEWKGMSKSKQAEILMNFRLAYDGFATVNWCPKLGTVLADAEVKEGKSERGNHPVERKLMRQWILRISAYSDRLLSGLDGLDWSDSLKAMQKNWIGRSEGASIVYEVEGSMNKLEVFTTRPDTIFGNTFMVVAPEHPIVEEITTPEQQKDVSEYVSWAKNRPEKDRIADTTKTGVWTGGFAIHPFSGNKLPIWISDYVVITYGTGAIMAVPAHDQRDWEFAHKFGIDIIEVISGGNISEGPYTSKDGMMVNSDFLNGLKAYEAIPKVIDKFEELNIGKGRITYKQRDVVWSRQRYWGEPTPIYYKDDIAYAIDEKDLPLVLPEVDAYLPSETGEPPLSRAEDWKYLPNGGIRDLNTMPGWAGSSWYFLRYPDANNQEKLADPDKLSYWLPVDLYIGGTEHAVTHLMYARFWTKFLYDINEIPVDEPFTKLVNQGKIQGVSELAYRHIDNGVFTSADLMTEDELPSYAQIHMHVQFVEDHKLDIEGYKTFTKQTKATFRTNSHDEFITVPQVEKMSKSLYNTVNPDDICEKYGADTLRLYEMFLGPLEMDKPWNTDGINGAAAFLRKTYNLFIGDQEELLVVDEKPSQEELRVLHIAIKKVEEGIERLAFNTCVPAFMVLERELKKLGSHKRAILEPFLTILSPFAPHFCEELWEKLGHTSSILHAQFPQWEEKYLEEKTVEYPVQINGKVRFKFKVDAEKTKSEIEELALSNPAAQKYLNGKDPRKVIVVPGRIINIVL